MFGKKSTQNKREKDQSPQINNIAPILRKSELIKHWVGPNTYAYYQNSGNIIYRNGNGDRIKPKVTFLGNEEKQYFQSAWHGSGILGGTEKLLKDIGVYTGCALAYARNLEHGAKDGYKVAFGSVIHAKSNSLASGLYAGYETILANMNRIMKLCVPSYISDNVEIHMDLNCRPHLPIIHIENDKLWIRMRALDAALFPYLLMSGGMNTLRQSYGEEIRRGEMVSVFSSSSDVIMPVATMEEAITATIGSIYSTMANIIWNGSRQASPVHADPDIQANSGAAEITIANSYLALEKARQGLLFAHCYQGGLPYLEASAINEVGLSEFNLDPMHGKRIKEDMALLNYVACAGRKWMTPEVVEYLGKQIPKSERMKIDEAFDSMPVKYDSQSKEAKQSITKLSTVLRNIKWLDFPQLTVPPWMKVPGKCSEGECQEDEVSETQSDLGGNSDADKPPEGEEGEQDNDSQGDSGEDGDSGESDNSGENDDSQRGGGSDADSEEGESDSRGGGGSGTGDEEEELSPESKPELNEEEMNSILENILSNSDSEEMFGSLSDLRESMSAGMGMAGEIVETGDGYMEPTEKGLKQLHHHETELKNLLSEYESGWHCNQEYGDLNFDDYVSTRGKEKKIFDDYYSAYNPFAAEMVVLVDCSGSMGSETNRYENMHTAYEGAWVLAASTSKVNMPVHVICYGDGRHRSLYNADESPDKTVIRTLSRESRNEISGGTDPESAIKNAKEILEKSEMPLKILVTLTDGYWQTGGAIAKDLREMHKDGVQSLIILLGSGVDSGRMVANDDCRREHDEYTRETLWHQDGIKMSGLYFQDNYASSMIDYLLEKIEEHDKTAHILKRR